MTFCLQALKSHESATRFRMLREGDALSFGEVISLLGEDESFREAYLAGLVSSGYAAFFWEHPGLLRKHLLLPYECILQQSDRLGTKAPQPAAFDGHFQADQPIATFQNLGSNAWLLSPAPGREQGLGQDEAHIRPALDYGHFAAFLRHAPAAQQHQLLVAISELLGEQLNDEAPLWLSTAGMGVAWLHVRLDQRPKYYRTRAYKNPAFLKKLLHQKDGLSGCS